MVYMKLKGYSKSEMNKLNQALQIALESDCRQRVGAIAVKGGSVLATATNKDRNHPDILEPEKVRFNAAICAERRVLASLSDASAKGATIYVVRAGRCDNSFAYSKPCDRCVDEMDKRQVKRCIYINQAIS